MCLREKIGPDPRNFNQRVSLGRNDLLIRTFPKALVLTVAATTFCLMTSPAFAVEETTPQNMTCQEFMDMNPKA